ncbi:Long-chain-fatty-acid--CoA ligase OS=Stutzerimonas stutzeri OX=316 GN=LO50_11550 PE=4 SV=1 [Stutzerimonas stutzeri]
MQGYPQSPREEPPRALRDGWLFTGDVGLIDEDGFLASPTAVKDLITRGGENISAQGIEHCASSHPEVSEAAALAMADGRVRRLVVLPAAAGPPG